MIIRKLEQADFDTVLSMMLVFYASDALLVHPSEEVLRKTLTDALADTPYLEAFGFEENGILAGYGMVPGSSQLPLGVHEVQPRYLGPQDKGKELGFPDAQQHPQGETRKTGLPLAREWSVV